MLKAVFLTLALFSCQVAALAQTISDDDIKVKVQKDGDNVVIDLDVVVDATPQEAWSVLTDFDHMPQFLKNLQVSKTLEKNGNKWKVYQKGQASHAGFSFSFESTREVDLIPFSSMHSHLLSGTMKKQESQTQLSPSGNGTHIVYHSESISNVWVPPMIGISVVEGEVRKQFRDMAVEMLKRKASAKHG